MENKERFWLIVCIILSAILSTSALWWVMWFLAGVV